ncbi:MAG: nicotinate-nucleotide adenylyltransferase [Gammaproteobacteria bacterium]|nr:nicotinate-nucleotide adenylyltransferase [Gammaproteobacteria bacterium]
MTRQRIGLFGGTFDPVHFGHLRPALELRESLHLEVLRLLPCHLPAHRDQPGATSRQRIEMLELAVDGVDGLVVDPREAQRDTWSYTVDTLSGFHTENTSLELIFFLGMDAFAKFTTWHRFEAILDLAHLVIIDRPGAEVGGEEERLLMSRQVDSLDSAPAPHGAILLQRVSQSDISATRIRELVAAGRDIRYLVPEAVYDYILENNLYRAA